MKFHFGSLGLFLNDWKERLVRVLFFKRKKTLAVLGGEECLCLNLQEQEVKLAVLTSKLPGSKQIDQFYNISNQGLSEDGIVKALQPLIADLHFKHPRLIGIISSNFAVTRNIEIPSRDPDEIREILSLQASRHTPYARNEIIIDYINLGVFKSVYTKVLFIIVPRKVVMRYYDLASQLNLQIDKIVFIPEAIARFFWKHLNILNEKLPVCIIQIDSAMSEFLIMARGAALFVRSIPVGAKHFEVAKEGYLPRFIAELKKSFDTYQSENIDLMPAQIVLGGATQGLEDLGSSIQEAFNMSVKQVSDMDALSLQPELRKKCAGQNWALLSAAMPGMFVDELAVDLSPEESKFKRILAERSKQVIKTGILTMILFGLLCFSVASRIFFKTIQLQQLTARYEPIKKEARSLEETYARVRAIKTHLAMRGMTLDALAELSSLISADLYLTDVKFESGKKIDIKGSSYTKPSIFTLVEKMENSKLFKNVQTKYITGRTEGEGEVSDFEIVASLK